MMALLFPHDCRIIASTLRLTIVAAQVECARLQLQLPAARRMVGASLTGDEVVVYSGE